MIGVGMKLNQAKSLFLDRPAIMNMVEARELRFLGRVGGYVRKTAKRSIRKRKKPSRPGQPPTNQTGVLKAHIFYVRDQIHRSVLVGPTKTNQVFFRGDGEPVNGTVPEVLEEGGEIRVLEWELRPGFWRRADLRQKRKLAERRTRLRAVKIAARSFMGPAQKKVEPKLRQFWDDSISV